MKEEALVNFSWQDCQADIVLGNRCKFQKFFLALALLFFLSGLVAFPVRAGDSVSEEKFRQFYQLPQAPEPLAREILSRKEFQQSPFEHLIDRLLNRLSAALAELLTRLFKRLYLPRGFKIDPEISWTAVGIALLGMLVLIGTVASWYAFKSWRSRTAMLSPADKAKQGDSFGASNSGELWDQALQTAEQARYADALVLLFRFLVSRLHEEGMLSFYRGKTNREILDSLEQEPFRDLVAEMVIRFNRVRYGREACGKADYDEFLTLCRRVSLQI